MRIDDRSIYDPATGYMLVGGVGCGGSSYGETLTRDRYEVARKYHEVPGFKPLYGVKNGSEEMTVSSKPLKLVTGNGVRIGDTPSQVVARLGRPTRIKSTGNRHQFRVFHYHWHDAWSDGPPGHVDQDGTTYEQDYTFKKGKLIEIRYDAVDDITG
jgi:hypothetical protein